MDNASTSGKEVQKRWGDSEASRLTMSAHLPVGPESRPAPTLSPDAASHRGNEVLKLVQFSGEAMGRSSDVRLMYIRAMGEQYASVDFLDRARETTAVITAMQEHGMSIDSQPHEVKQAIIDDIRDLNVLSERVWGEVERPRFESMVARVRRKASAVLAGADAPQYKRLAADNILRELPEVDDTKADEHNYAPSPELLKAYEPMVRKKYADFLALVPDKPTLTRDELKAFFERCIHCMANTWKLDNASAWHVAFGRTNVSVDIEAKTVWIPETYADVTKLKAEQLSVHEIGGHLLRNLLGEKTGDAFMATHMPRRTGDEEALLTTLESTLSGTTREAGLAYYVAVGLGRDTMRTGTAPDAQELESIMADVNIINAGMPELKARRGAKNQVFRVTRGMPSVVIDGIRHQAFWTSDLKYAIGQKNAIEWMETNKDRPQALDEVMAGKFAYSDQMQEQYAHQLYVAKIAGRFKVPSAA